MLYIAHIFIAGPVRNKQIPNTILSDICAVDHRNTQLPFSIFKIKSSSSSGIVLYDNKEENDIQVNKKHKTFYFARNLWNTLMKI